MTRNVTEDFCWIDTPAEHRLSNVERLTLVPSDDLDKLLGRFVRQFAGFAITEHFRSIELDSFAAAAALFREEPFHSNPESFFDIENETLLLEEIPVHGLGDGEVVDLRFELSAEPRHPQAREFKVQASWGPAVIRYWRHFGGPRHTVVAVHGWSMGDPRVASMAFLPGVLYQSGLDVILYELPGHGRRAKGESEMSATFGVNAVATAEYLRWVIAELRAVSANVRARGNDVGVMGMSLGGYISTLWAGLDSLAFCVSLVPLVSMSELAWDILSRHTDFKRYRDSGLTPELLADAYAVHSPLKYPARLSREQALIIAGIGDEVLSPRQAKLLWDHWARPQITWRSGGHSAHVQNGHCVERIIDFLQTLPLPEILPG